MQFASLQRGKSCGVVLGACRQPGNTLITTRPLQRRKHSMYWTWKKTLVLTLAVLFLTAPLVLAAGGGAGGAGRGGGAGNVSRGASSPQTSTEAGGDQARDDLSNSSGTTAGSTGQTSDQERLDCAPGTGTASTPCVPRTGSSRVDSRTSSRQGTPGTSPVKVSLH